MSYTKGTALALCASITTQIAGVKSTIEASDPQQALRQLARMQDELAQLHDELIKGAVQ